MLSLCKKSVNEQICKIHYLFIKPLGATKQSIIVQIIIRICIQKLFTAIFFSNKNGFKHFPEKTTDIMKKRHFQMILKYCKVTNPGFTTFYLSDIIPYLKNSFKYY